MERKAKQRSDRAKKSFVFPGFSRFLPKKMPGKRLFEGISCCVSPNRVHHLSRQNLNNAAALWAVNSGRFDTLQISVNIADQAGIATISAANRAGMGVIAKRPVANAAWITGQKPANSYAHGYWDRLQKLQYDFLSLPGEAGVAHALRFTLSIPGVSTAIVGTMHPERWPQNLQTVAKGNLLQTEYGAIRTRWDNVANADWVGLI